MATGQIYLVLELSSAAQGTQYVHEDVVCSCIVCSTFGKDVQLGASSVEGSYCRYIRSSDV